MGSACAPDAPADPDYVAGRTVYRTCASCHGGQGQGGSGPTLEDVRLTFVTCDDQVEWITLGSDRWLREVGDTYGTGVAKEVEGGMPSHEESLTVLERRQVALYERVRFGGADLEAEKAECGLGP